MFSLSAAKDTGALQDAKGKLEKTVEELTSQLELEKCLRAELEVAKTREIARLQQPMEEIQITVQEYKTTLDKEREILKKTIADTPVQKEVPVIDHDAMNKLAAENEHLKDLVDSLKNKVAETTKISEERLEKAQEAESKILELNAAMKSLEDKIANMEREYEILQHQSALSSSTGKMSGHLSMENGHANDANKEGQGSLSAKSLASDSVGKRDSFTILIECVSRNIGFSNGKPVAAFAIYKCLLHWKSFEMEKTSVFDGLIRVVGSALEY